MKKFALYALFLVPALALAGHSGESHYLQITGRESRLYEGLANAWLKNNMMLWLDSTKCLFLMCILPVIYVTWKRR